jgi:hypothetical protein
LGLGECLHADVAVVSGRGIDGCVAEEGGVAEARDRRGQLVVGVRAGDDDFELRAPLAGVGGFGGGERGAEEGALYEDY